MQQHDSAAYRPDIDGLRGIAVAAVVLFHAFPGVMPGGFVGVDVFFVISGFLISSIVYEALARGTFSISDFYVRRVRRILPALVLVVLAVLAFGYFVLVRDEYVQLGKHVLSAALFVSNLTLYLESGYFDLSSESKPLLHLWSLGIEEQFYLLWPLAVAFFWRRKWPVLLLVFSLCALSFSANLLLVGRDPSAAFFLPVSRFWELMVGCGLAFVLRRTALSGVFAHACGWVGLALIAASIFFFHGRMPFPGWVALVPVTGTALIIGAGAKASPNRHLLALRPLVGLGLISYPLYLWHWPMLSYAHILEDSRPVYQTRVYLLIASLVLAWLTYRMVERPIRFGSLRNRERVLVGTLAIAGVLGLTAYSAPEALSRNYLAPRVVNPGDIGHEEFYQFLQAQYVPCEPLGIRQGTGKWRGLVRCFQSRAGHPTVAVLGDSHAEHLMIGIVDANPAENIVYYLRSAPPTLENPKAQEVMRYIMQAPNIRKVVLAIWWRGEKLFMDERQMVDTVDALRSAGKEVYLVEDVPWFSFYPQRCKYSGMPFREQHKCDDVADGTLPNQGYYSAVLAAGEKAGAHVLWTTSLFCSGARCSMAPNGKLLFRDRHHLNVEGSRYVGKRLALAPQQP